jgi:hypothetical protein
MVAFQGLKGPSPLIGWRPTSPRVARDGTFGPDIAHGLLMDLILSKRITTEPTVSVAVVTFKHPASRRT